MCTLKTEQNKSYNNCKCWRSCEFMILRFKFDENNIPMIIKLSSL